MNRQDYFPTRAAQQVVWLQNFANKFGAHAAKFGAVAADWIAEALWLVYLMSEWLPAQRAHQKACTETVNIAKSGTGTDPLELPVFVAPTLPAGVVPKPPGGLERIFNLVAQMKAADAYDTPTGNDLMLIGTGKTPPTEEEVRPVIKVKVVGSKVEIEWGWGGFAAFLDQLEIQVDRGTGWTLLTIDSTPGYTDSTPFPAAPAKWKYRAIYLVDDERFGQWSAEECVNVG